MASEHPLLAHDFNELRRLALTKLATSCGEEALVDQAVEKFFLARSAVSGNFYSDTIECLEWFHNLGIKIGVLTNGSADLSKCPILRKYLSLTFTAKDIGASKPSPIGFMACSQVGKRGFLALMPVYPFSAKRVLPPFHGMQY